MTLDLSPLEREAARQGLPSLRARVVPSDRRRGRWFTWRGGELLVSELVLDRCPPQDAAALLVDAIVLERRLARARRAAGAWLAGSLGTSLALALTRPDGFGDPLVWALLVVGLSTTLVLESVLRGRAVLAADDEAVERLGDPVPLVRGLNAMDQDELHVGGRRWSARPDLHRRAERLARRHALCDAAGGAPDATAAGGPSP